MIQFLSTSMKQKTEKNNTLKKGKKASCFAEDLMIDGQFKLKKEDILLCSRGAIIWRTVIRAGLKCLALTM